VNRYRIGWRRNIGFPVSCPTSATEYYPSRKADCRDGEEDSPQSDLITAHIPLIGINGA
jgi:hypothetical protein